MPALQEDISRRPQECKRLIPEAKTSVDGRLKSVINMALDNCDHQLSLHQPELAAIGDPKTFSNYLNSLRSAINNPVSSNNQHQYLIREYIDQGHNCYRINFLSQTEAQTQNDFLHPINEFRLVVSHAESGFNIAYLLLVSEASIHMFQQLAAIDINIQTNGDTNTSLKVYSDKGCFRSEPIFAKNKTESSPGIKAYNYLSTHLNLQ